MHTAIPTNNIKTLGYLGAGLLITLAVGGTVAYATPVMSNNNVQQAVTNKDFEAFKKAIIDNATTRSNSLTQEEFNKITTRNEQSVAVKNAIAANDYEAFKKSGDEKMLAKVNTQEEFNKLVENNKKREQEQAKILETVKNNDFEAYKQVLTSSKKEREANMPAEISRNKMSKHGIPPQITDDNLKTRFNELVDYYKANNSLPVNSKMGMPKMHHDKGMDGDRVLGNF